jgi:Flp pilus assembly protein TadB
MGIELIVAIIAASAMLLSALLVYATSRRKNQITEFGANLALNKYIDERVDRLVEERIGDVRDRLHEAERRSTVFVRIVKAIATQWPYGYPPPVLDPEDVLAAEDALPPHWFTEKE